MEKIDKNEIIKKAEEVFESSKEKAKEILDDKGKTEELINKAVGKINASPLGEGFNDIPVLVEMIKDYIKGDFKEIPVGSIISVVIAIAYWVSPIDIIPDVIPGVGYIDDAAVVMVCLKFIKADFDKYKGWKKQKELEANIIDAEITVK